MWLLDTNVVSEMRKANLGRALPGFNGWMRVAVIPECFISVITLFELELGIRQLERRNAEHGRRLRSSIDALMESTELVRRIIGIDGGIATRCAQLHVPTTLPERDAWIAATALERRLTVVTRNVADFQPTGVAVLNPWRVSA